MPKSKSGPNKSQAIRDYLAKNPKAKLREVIDGLAEQGIKVSQNLVYIVTGKAKAKKRRQNREKAVATSANAGNHDPVALVRDVRKLAENAGGIRRLKELVDLLAE